MSMRKLKLLKSHHFNSLISSLSLKSSIYHIFKCYNYVNIAIRWNGILQSSHPLSLLALVLDRAVCYHQKSFLMVIDWVMRTTTATQRGFQWTLTRSLENLALTFSPHFSFHSRHATQINGPV